MKRWLLAFAVFGMTQFCHADVVGEREHHFKSSFTNSADLNLSITSAPATVSSVCVGSGSANGYIVLYSTGGFDSAVSTRVFLRTDGTYSGKCHQLTSEAAKFYNGITYATVAAGMRITIFWDWLVKPDYTTPHDND